MIPARIKNVLLRIGEDEKESSPGLKSTMSPGLKLNSPINQLGNLPSEIKLRKINVVKI
jgi:hypothetical protein